MITRIHAGKLFHDEGGRGALTDSRSHCFGVTLSPFEVLHIGTPCLLVSLFPLDFSSGLEARLEAKRDVHQERFELERVLIPAASRPCRWHACPQAYVSSPGSSRELLGAWNFKGAV